MADFEDLTDEELIERSRAGDGPADAHLSALYERHYERVAWWCFKICGDRDEAGELAQEVFLRTHTRLASFRGDSRFTTWLYQVTRSVALNRLQSPARRRHESLDAENAIEPVDPTPSAEDRAEDGEIHRRLRAAMARDLEPLEARVLYLHFVDGLTLAAITGLLRLTNRSGAKAYLVAARRKLDRGFGRWLGAQSRPAGRVS